MSNQRVVYMYTKPEKVRKNQGRITVAGIIDNDRQEVRIHASRNNPSYNDVFEKKTGRKIALGRVQKNPLRVQPILPGQKGIDVFLELGKKIIENPSIIANHIEACRDQVQHRLNKEADERRVAKSKLTF